MLTHIIHYTAADCISLHGLCRASFRDAVSFRQRLPRRAQNCTLLAMTNLAGFEGKRNVHSGWKRLYPTKNVRFPNKSVPNLCHCEAAERPWQSLSQRHGIPWRGTGAENDKIPRGRSEFHCAVRTVPCRVRRKERSPQSRFATTVWSFY